MILDDVQVLKVERIKGENDGNKWDFTRVHVLDEVEVHQCRVSDDWPVNQPITEGQYLSARVTVNAFQSRTKGMQVGIRLENPVELPGLGARAASSASE